MHLIRNCITNMDYRILLLTTLCLFSGCSQQAKDSTNTFIVPSDTLTIHDTSADQSSFPIFPPYYMPSNFIIDTGGHIYYYHKDLQYDWTCGTVLNEKAPPSFIDLEPADIIEIPDDSLVQLIKQIIKYPGNSNKLFAVASVMDTITSAGLSKIFIEFKDTANHISWIFRRTTMEESVVLDYKKKNKRYNFKEIKWGSTKIRQPPPLEFTQFKPPGKSKK